MKNLQSVDLPVACRFLDPRRKLAQLAGPALQRLDDPAESAGAVQHDGEHRLECGSAGRCGCHADRVGGQVCFWRVSMRTEICCWHLVTAADGKLLWQHEVAKGSRKDYRSNFASSSPVTDGQIVVFFYGNGDLVCYDLDGQQKWARNIQKDYGDFAFLWTFSSSPLLFGTNCTSKSCSEMCPSRVVACAARRTRSYLLAMDPQTGQTLWRHFRPSKAVAESRESFSYADPVDTWGRRRSC
jgi:hypothetical protein